MSRVEGVGTAPFNHPLIRGVQRAPASTSTQPPGRPGGHPRADRAGRRHAAATSTGCRASPTEHDLHLRPHVKTHKCVEIGRRQVEAGAVGITAGNVGEAEVFAAAGFEDIFLAYPVWPSGTKGDRIRRLAQTTRMRVGVDNVAAIEALAEAMGDEPDRLQVRGGDRLRRPPVRSAARGRGRPRTGSPQARAGACRGLHLSGARQLRSGLP